MTARREVLDLCFADKRNEAMAVAFEASDPVAMLVVSVFDLASVPRFELLLDAKDGPALATEIVLAGVERGDPEDRLTKLAFKVIPMKCSRMRLSEPQGAALLAQLRREDDPFAPDEAAGLLKWLADHHRSAALGFAGEYSEGTTPGPPDDLASASAALLGSDDGLEAHAALLAYAGRCLEAGHPDAHDAILGHLAVVGDADVAELVSQLGTFAANGWGLAPNLIRLLERLKMDQIRVLISAVPDPISESWLIAHLLPTVFVAHVASFVDTLDQKWWPAVVLQWLLSDAPWGEQPAELVIRAFRAVKRREDPSLAASNYSMLRRQVQAADATCAIRKAMPVVGARTLLNEALAGELSPDDTELKQALVHLDQAVRSGVYSDTNWAQPTRAQRLAQIVVVVNVEDIIELGDEVLRLGTAARQALLSAIAPHLSEAAAEHFVEIARSDEDALVALTSGPPGESAVFARWQESADLLCFRALAGGAYDEARLEPVAALVRSYQADMTPSERHDLLEALGPTQDRYELLIQIMTDWGGHPGPDDNTLMAVLGLMSEHLSAGVKPDPFVSAVAPICRQHQLAVRKAAYAAIGRARPTPQLTDLLNERVDGETSGGRPAVREAVTAVTGELIELAKSDDPHSAVTAVGMLERLRSQEALPFARRLARSAIAPDDRISAIRIVAHHGDRATDPALLREIAEGDTAHPDPKVRAEAHRAIRRLEIGDLHAAHERLGELAGRDAAIWNTLDPTRLFGLWAEPIRHGLDRVAENQANENWGQAIDQLGEVAKILLFRAIELAGAGAGISPKLVAGASDNTLEFGAALGAQQLLNTWGWVHHFAALYDLRTEHLAERGTIQTPPSREQVDFEHALRLFRDGAGSCCDIIGQHAP